MLIVQNVKRTAGCITAICIDALCIHFKARHHFSATFPCCSGSQSPADQQSEVIVDVVSRRPCNDIVVLVTYLEAGGVVPPLSIDRGEQSCSWEIVQNPFSKIAMLDQVLRPLYGPAADRAVTQMSTLYILTHVDLDVRVALPIASEDLTKILGQILPAGPVRPISTVARGRTDEGEVEVGELRSRVIRVYLVD